MATLNEPITTASTPQLLPTHAAGSPPIKTVGAPGVAMGTGEPKVPLLTIMSVTRAANDMVRSYFEVPVRSKQGHKRDYGPTCT
jgi:hypothetical protein